MLRLDLAQVPRLLQIETNHRERLDEAKRMQWLGEVAAIDGWPQVAWMQAVAAEMKEGLRHIESKKQQAERLRLQSERAEAGATALA